jgi:hypothetical protein
LLQPADEIGIEVEPGLHVADRAVRVDPVEKLPAMLREALLERVKPTPAEF